RLEDGSFYKSPGGADAALKLISLFNFANWLRRLQLDFSDVVGQNLAYNNLSGNIRFEDGVAKLADPLKMRMPSGRMSIAGDFDLTRETVDAQLVATLPVATNLPWVVALMGGLPAAAGVYVTSKLVEKQVDRLSSISYKVSGPWDDVEVAVDKIFAAELKNVQEDESSEAVPSGAEGQDSQ
ncbi:MAG: AsmA-like C-terminal region-containing protein, partial [Porticoccaceae bacterium]